MNADEKAAVVGRFVMSPEARPDPAGSGVYGREQAAPHGVVYVRAEAFEGAEAEAEPEAEEAEAEVPAAEEPELDYDAADEDVPPPEPDDDDDVDPGSMTIPQIKAELDALGVAYDQKALKAELVAALEKAEAAG
jgi:hypothetical protein